MKVVLVVLVTVFISACAAPGEKHIIAPATSVDEASGDALGDWNARDPIERLLLPVTRDLA